MKKIGILLTALMVISVGILSGCTEQNQSGVVTSSKPPANINIFASAEEGEMIRFYFILEDADGAKVVSDGHVKIEIFDDLDTSLYMDEFDVKSSEYIDYAFQLTGTTIGKAYEWRVPVEDIEKGTSLLEFGIGKLHFLTPEFKSLYAEDTLVPIPIYTEEELEAMEEDEYEQSALSVSQTISKGNFKVTVFKVGFYNKYEWGIQEYYFRVDMEVKNIGTESDYFMPSRVVILDVQNNQYEENYLGTLNTFSTVYPGVTINGYLLFEDVPETITTFRLVFELGYDESFNPYLFEYNINLA